MRCRALTRCYYLRLDKGMFFFWEFSNLNYEWKRKKTGTPGHLKVCRLDGRMRGLPISAENSKYDVCCKLYILFSSGRWCFLALSAVGHAVGTRVHYGASLGPGRAPWYVLWAFKVAGGWLFSRSVLPPPRRCHGNLIRTVLVCSHGIMAHGSMARARNHGTLRLCTYS